jgi:ABC-type amino acid transport substrate-binding protein
MKTLKVGAAFPDPPFNGMPDNTGLDIDLMTEIAKALGRGVEFIPYEGPDFDGIFDALNSGTFDCVAAGTTVTPERGKKAVFAPPYLISGQSLAVDTRRLPAVRSVDDLAGLTIGVQQGNTSGPIADKLVADGKAARVRVYDYGEIRNALNDLSTGVHAIGSQAPVLTELVKPIAGVEVVQRGISTENIAIAVGARRSAAARPITPLRKSWTRAAHCSESGGNGWATPTSTSSWPCTEQTSRGEYHTTRLSVEHPGKKGDTSDHPGRR